MPETAFMPVSVTLPAGNFQGQFRFTSDLGFRGCEGFVRPGVVLINGEERLVQAKSFFRDSVDDRGDYFSQDPAQKVEESYQAFKRLDQLGFRVLPFYGMTELEGRPLLLLHDLREGNKIEVYDEKCIHRRRMVENVIGDRSVMSDALATFEGLANAGHVRMQMMRTSLLQNAYNISLGFPGGTAHMITRDPETNVGDVFVVDVGQFGEGRGKYSGAVDRERAVSVPDSQIRSAFAALLGIHHPGEDAETHFGRFQKERALKRDFMDVVFKATVGLSLWERVGGWYKDAEWARRIFPKNTFPDPMMQAKLSLAQISKSLAAYVGETLFDVSAEARARFLQGGEILLGVDFAYLAALDRRMMYAFAVRKAVDEGAPMPEPDDGVIFEKDGFPAMSFFERVDETINERHVVQVEGERDYVLDVELDWETAMDVGMSLLQPPIEPEQIKSLSFGGKKVRKFDPAKIEVLKGGPETHPLWRDDIVYLYEDEIIYRTRVRKQPS